jgi:FlaG/FlaF family flagellin (archaellin)
MLKVNTLKELKAQQSNLRVRKSFLDAEVKASFDELKAEFTSVKAVSQNAGEVLGSKNNTILGFSMGSLADFLTEKVILKNSGLITKLVVPFIVKAATSSLVENNKSKIMGWLGNLTGKLAGGKA